MGKDNWPFFPALLGAGEVGLSPRRIGSTCFLQTVLLGSRKKELPIAGSVQTEARQLFVVGVLLMPRPGQSTAPQLRGPGGRVGADSPWSFPSDPALEAQGFLPGRSWSDLFRRRFSRVLQSLGLGVRVQAVASDFTPLPFESGADHSASLLVVVRASETGEMLSAVPGVE